MDEKDRLTMALMRAEMEWTRMAFIELLRTLGADMNQATAQGLLDRTKRDIELLDQGTAHLADDQRRAKHALAFLAAMKEALGVR
jgi:hypothetical protein